MARIRTIKPEFFTSESVLSVSPLARLLFIGLWCEADREGRLKWKPKTLKFRYLPADSVNIEKLCDELESEGMICTYCISGVDYCEIPGFSSHQVINNREKDSELPSRDSDASTTRESGRKEGKEGKERKGSTRFTPPSLKEVIQYCLERGNNIDANKFIDYYSANGWMRGKNKIKDWKACVRTWEGNSINSTKQQTKPKAFSQ
ncbi:MAG: hypothetical protein GY920_21555 [Aliivibrio sp.]|nr:hypothetical protein [Aliivibrio sp.]MCP4255869.1 hypothetical protein [Candidatus Scalindua sp.]